MKQYSVEYVPHVMKKFAKLDASVRARIKTWIETNLEGCENPRLHGAPLRGAWYGYWRYRVGDRRIVAKILDDKVIILVVKIDKRGDIS